MNDGTARSVHWSFWVIGAIALIWNGLGAVNFLVQMSPDSIAAYRESEQLIIDGRPLWATAAFAVAVFGGAIGGILLLLRRSAAFYLFAASLVGVIVTMLHTLGSGIEFGLGEILGIVLLPVVIAASLVWYSTLAQRKAWIH